MKRYVLAAAVLAVALVAGCDGCVDSGASSCEDPGVAYTTDESGQCACYDTSIYGGCKATRVEWPDHCEPFRIPACHSYESLDGSCRCDWPDCEPVEDRDGNCECEYKGHLPDCPEEPEGTCVCVSNS